VYALRAYGAGCALILGRNVMQIQRQSRQSSDWWCASVGMHRDMQGAGMEQSQAKSVPQLQLHRWNDLEHLSPPCVGWQDLQGTFC